ncbi:hypothetical protein AB1E18_004689 [Capra hircus]
MRRRYSHDPPGSFRETKVFGFRGECPGLHARYTDWLSVCLPYAGRRGAGGKGDASGGGGSPRRPASRPAAAAASPPPACVPLPARPSPPRPWRWARGFGGGAGVGAAPCASPPPHRPWRRPRPPLPGPRTPRGAGPPVASRGLCGGTGGGFPVAGPLAPPRRLPRRRPWAGLPRPVVVGRPAALGPSRGRRAPPRAPPGLGALSRPRPHPPRLPAARVSPSGFSRPLDAPPARWAPSFPSEPLPPALCPRWWWLRGRVPGSAGAGRGAPPTPGGWGREAGGGPAEPGPYGTACEGAAVGKGLCPVPGGRVGPAVRRPAGPSGRRSTGARRGPPVCHGPAAPRPARAAAGGDAAVGGPRRGAGVARGVARRGHGRRGRREGATRRSSRGPWPCAARARAPPASPGEGGNPPGACGVPAPTLARGRRVPRRVKPLPAPPVCCFPSDSAGRRQPPPTSSRLRGGSRRRRDVCRASGGSPAEAKRSTQLVRLLAVDHSALQTRRPPEGSVAAGEIAAREKGEGDRELAPRPLARRAFWGRSPPPGSASSRRKRPLGVAAVGGGGRGSGTVSRHGVAGAPRGWRGWGSRLPVRPAGAPPLPHARGASPGRRASAARARFPATPPAALAPSGRAVRARGRVRVRVRAPGTRASAATRGTPRRLPAAARSPPGLRPCRGSRPGAPAARAGAVAGAGGDRGRAVRPSPVRASSARRIQPGGGPGRAGGPADLSRSPCLPTPPPALPPPLAALPVRLRAGGGRRRGGRGGGRAGPGVGPAGDRPPAGDRAPPGAFPPRRCAATGSGTAGKARRGRWLGGAPPPSRGGGGPALPGCYSPAGSSARRIPGPREPALVAALSPLPALPPPRGSRSREGASPAGGRAGVSSRGAGPPPPFAGAGVGSGRGGLSPVRPGRVAPSGPGGRVSGRTAGTPSERTGSAAMSATHPTRLETRTKESNTCASQGLARKPPWRNEGEGRPQPAAEVGSRGLSQSAEGAPPARLARRAGEVEHERTC